MTLLYYNFIIFSGLVSHCIPFYLILFYSIAFLSSESAALSLSELCVELFKKSDVLEVEFKFKKFNISVVGEAWFSV